jgi:hypothetical protein
MFTLILRLPIHFCFKGTHPWDRERLQQ